jgi:hypothetical protein
MAKSQGWEPPEIEFAPPGMATHLDAAWPQRRIAITLEQPAPSLQGWKFFNIAEFVEVVL